jgi:hypothetical protein
VQQLDEVFGSWPAAATFGAEVRPRSRVAWRASPPCRVVYSLTFTRPFDSCIFQMSTPAIQARRRD